MTGRLLLVTREGSESVASMLALADQLVARGHAVRAMGTASLAERFEARGLGFTARDPLVEWDEAALAREVHREAQGADAVISDHLAPGALCGAEAAHRPSVALVPALIAGHPEGAGGLLARHQPAGIDSLAAVRAELGLPPVTSFGALLERATRVLVTVPEELDAPAGDRAANVRYVGPLLDGAGGDAGWRPPGVDDGRPLVVVALGAGAEGAALPRVLSALADAPLRVVVRTDDPRAADELSGARDAHVIGLVRLAAVLPWASAVVGDEDLDTILASLAHALPVICLPLGSGRPENVGAVEEVGVGIAVAPDATPAAIRAAASRAVDDLELRAAAARMALRIDVLRPAPVEEVEALL